MPDVRPNMSLILIQYDQIKVVDDITCGEIIWT